MLSEKEPNSFSQNQKLFFEDLGRPLEDNVWLTNFEEVIGYMTENYNLSFHLRETPSITYALGREIRFAARDIETFKATRTTNEVISKLVDNKVISHEVAFHGLIIYTQSIKFKNFGNDSGRHDVRLRIKDIPTNDGYGSLLYNERRKIQKSLGINLKQKESETTQPIDLVLGTIFTSKDSRPVGTRLINEVDDFARNSRLTLGRLASYSTFKPLQSY